MSAPSFRVRALSPHPYPLTPVLRTRGQLGRGFTDNTPPPRPAAPTDAGNAGATRADRGSIFEAERIVLPSGLAAKHVSAGGRKDSGHTSIVDVDGGCS